MRSPTSSVAERFSRGAQSLAQVSWRYIRGPGRQTVTSLATRFARRVRVNLTARRLLSFPHLVVLAWLVVLLWGERWTFDSSVGACEWKKWERWPGGASPHHLVLVADPQIVDPHTYPGRPWPLSSLTVAVSDTYLRRGSRALQTRLHPDSLFFLGDLFDGGREWKTRLGKFVDPKWGIQRSAAEKKVLRTWRRKYGQDFWLREYKRFGDIFFDGWNEGGDEPGPWQRGRKLVASLPGNHDLGFGAMVQVPVRDRFSAYFGEGNRVDMIGNHTIVSVDTVSLSAGSSDYREGHDLKAIYGPATEFLDGIRKAKRKLVQEELNVWYGVAPSRKMKHAVEDLDYDAPSPPAPPSRDSDRAQGPDFPTILLTHVPLYRPPGTPCGPLRERWPPTKGRGAGEGDERNAISVRAGYQYQNVLGEADSIKLISTVGNVVHVFSGDDHDYCEITHSSSKQGVREITVKSMSMTMGVARPGFLMVSLYNPVDPEGEALPGAPGQTLQTHLCILPDQMRTYLRYATLAVATILVLAVRASLVPVMQLTPFALEEKSAGLPLHKKEERVVKQDTHWGASSARIAMGGTARHNTSRWERGGPRIRIEEDYMPEKWKATRRGRRLDMGSWGREMGATSWRVGWMTVAVWIYLQ